MTALMALALTGVAQAQSPPSDAGVTPILETDNVSCASLNADPATYPGVTSNFGFKIDTDPSGGRYSLTSGTQYGDPTLLTGGAPSDTINSVTVTPTGHEAGTGPTTTFDWSATLGIDAVIVKAKDSNVYVYTPEDYRDGNLQAPELKAISHVEFCYDYELVAAKTATAEFTRSYTWGITKDADPSSHAGFAGDEFLSRYDVTVDRTVTDGDFGVSGGITVANPTPFVVTFRVDDSVGGTAAVVDCPTLTLAPGATTTCTYHAPLSSRTDGTNTATITSTAPAVKGATASAQYAFGAPTTVHGQPTIKVTDSAKGALGSASDDKTFEYTRRLDCSRDPADYTNGKDTDTHPNTATIDETGQSDGASVVVTCFAPVVSKDASTEWRRTFGWSIAKTADPTTHNGLSGDSFNSSYKVAVDQTVTDHGFKAFGTISVSNRADAPGSLAVDVADAVGNHEATVDCGGGGTTLTVAPGATATCSYTVQLPDNTDRTNTATATMNAVAFTATAAVDFGDPVVEGHPTVTVIDSHEGILGPASGDKTFSYTRTFGCSSTPGDYTNGADSDVYPNTATIDETRQSASASVTVNCALKGLVTVKKTTNGVVDPTKSIDFRLTGPGLPNSGLTLNAFGDADGVLEFGRLLRPNASYTVCENPVPAGFTSFWKLDGVIVTPSNPDAASTPPEDMGVRCYAFSAAAGQTRSFVIDNSRPGGDPRTIGYWKNWNACTGGNQSATASKNGGAAAGFFVVEDLLPQLVGDFSVTSCVQAVKVLAKQNQSGQNMSSDAAYELASQLLAAKFNLAAGAETCSGVQSAVAYGQRLLDRINFVGSNTYLTKKSTDRTAALDLAAQLDRYNNGNLCS